VAIYLRHFRTSADISGQFGTSAEMSWVRSVLGPKCLDTCDKSSVKTSVAYIYSQYNSTAPSKRGFVVHWGLSQRFGQPLRGTKGFL